MARASIILALSLVACAPASTTEEPTPPEGTLDRAVLSDPWSPARLIQQDRRPVAPVMSQSFEDASAECNDWTSEGATSIRSIPAHSGDYACKVCATGNGGSFSLARAVGKLAPGRYVLTAWIRTRPTAPVPRSVRAMLEAETTSGPLMASTPGALADAYTRVDVALDLKHGADSLRARIEAPTLVDAPPPCLLIDDVTVVRVGP